LTIEAEFLYLKEGRIFVEELGMSVLELVDACGERDRIVIVAKRWSRFTRKMNWIRRE